MIIGKKSLNHEKIYYTTALSIKAADGTVYLSSKCSEDDARYGTAMCIDYVYCKTCKSFEPVLFKTNTRTKNRFFNTYDDEDPNKTVCRLNNQRYHESDFGDKNPDFYCSKCHKRLYGEPYYLDFYLGIQKPISVYLFKETSKKGHNLLNITFLYRHITAYHLKLQVSNCKVLEKITINLDTACIYKIWDNKIQNVTYSKSHDIDLPDHIFNLIVKEIFNYYKENHPEIAPAKIQYLYNGTPSKKSNNSFLSIQRMVAAPMLTDKQFKTYYIKQGFCTEALNNPSKAIRKIDSLRKYIRNNRFITINGLSQSTFGHPITSTRNLSPQAYMLFKDFVSYESFKNYSRLFLPPYTEEVYNFITNEYVTDYRNYLIQNGFNEKKVQKTILSKILSMYNCSKRYLKDIDRMYIRLKYAEQEDYVFEMKKYMQGDFIAVHDLMITYYKKVNIPRLKYDYKTSLLKLEGEYGNTSISLAHDSLELATYGERLHICVQSYWEEAYKNKCHILFLYDKRTGELEGCIEITPTMQVKQIKGRRNASIKFDLKPDVKKWIDTNHLTLSTSDLDIVTYYDHIEGTNPYNNYIAQRM